MGSRDAWHARRFYSAHPPAAKSNLTSDTGCAINHVCPSIMPLETTRASAHFLWDPSPQAKLRLSATVAWTVSSSPRSSAPNPILAFVADPHHLTTTMMMMMMTLTAVIEPMQGFLKGCNVGDHHRHVDNHVYTQGTTQNGDYHAIKVNVCPYPRSSGNHAPSCKCRRQT